jgi:hypothetical protein
VIVELQFPGYGREPMKVHVPRSPSRGDVFEFAEDFGDEGLEGEDFEVRRVIFPVEAPRPLTGATMAMRPIVVLRRP